MQTTGWWSWKRWLVIFLVITVLDGAARAGDPENPPTMLPLLAFGALVMVIVCAVRSRGGRRSVPTEQHQNMPGPAVWAPDPWGRHQYRYWDGVSWTPYVSDGDMQGIDEVT